MLCLSLQAEGPRSRVQRAPVGGWRRHAVSGRISTLDLSPQFYGATDVQRLWEQAVPKALYGRHLSFLCERQGNAGSPHRFVPGWSYHCRRDAGVALFFQWRKGRAAPGDRRHGEGQQTLQLNGRLGVREFRRREPDRHARCQSARGLCTVSPDAQRSGIRIHRVPRKMTVPTANLIWAGQAGNRAAAGGDRKRDFPAPPRLGLHHRYAWREAAYKPYPKDVLSGRRWIASQTTTGSVPAERKLCRVAPPGSIGGGPEFLHGAGAQLHLAAATDRIRFTLHNVT